MAYNKLISVKQLSTTVATNIEINKDGIIEKETSLKFVMMSNEMKQQLISSTDSSTTEESKGYFINLF